MLPYIYITWEVTPRPIAVAYCEVGEGGGGRELTEDGVGKGTLVGWSQEVERQAPDGGKGRPGDAADERAKVELSADRQGLDLRCQRFESLDDIIVGTESEFLQQADSETTEVGEV